MAFPYTNFHDLNLNYIMRTIAALAGGRRGQILTKKSNTPYDYAWETPSGGGGGAVESVNGQTGDVVLSAADVGALPDSYTPPVQSVNGQTGNVVLSAANVGALPDSYTPPTEIEYVSTTNTYAEIAAIVSGGKLPILKQGGAYYCYIGAVNNQPAFVRVFAGTSNNTITQYTCSSNNVWTPTTRNLAPVASPTFTGSPAATTPAINNSSTRIATTAFVHNLIDSKNYVDAAGAAAAAPVQSVNGQTGDVILDADAVGALPDNTVIPSKTSDLNNDSGFVNAAGAAAAAPVQSVNGMTGNVIVSGGGGMTFTLLWTNPNPDTSFSAQTVPLDLTNYDAVWITYATGSRYDSKMSLIDGNKYMVTTGIDSSSNAYIYQRGATATSSGVDFTNGYRGTSAGGTNAIPQKIYGIKF